jgi:ABC-2 type transport system permease protein
MDLAARLAPPGRAFAASVRLGWEVSSNWTQPLVFVIYSILRPLSSALILVVIYTFVTGRRGSTGTYLAFLVTGTAFWGFVNSGLAGFAIGIAEDRGRFRMLKYVYIAPQRFFLFLLGRWVLWRCAYPSIPCASTTPCWRRPACWPLRR